MTEQNNTTEKIEDIAFPEHINPTRNVQALLSGLRDGSIQVTASAPGKLNTEPMPESIEELEEEYSPYSDDEKVKKAQAFRDHLQFYINNVEVKVKGGGLVPEANDASTDNVPAVKGNTEHGDDETFGEKKYARIRQFNENTNRASALKTSFAKPVELGGNKKLRLLVMLIACIVVGIFFAVEANSYYNAKRGEAVSAATATNGLGGTVAPAAAGGEAPSAMACAFMWVTNFDTLKVSLSPMNMSVMTAGFLSGAGILGLICLFIALGNEQKRLSRVGHEHGNARLGTAKDFKSYQMKFMDNNDNNMLFGVYKGQQLGLSLNNKKVNRSANVLVIGGTGTGKTFKYIKPNILQENCSMIITDPSGDIFRSFAPYLLSKGYNVYLFNASDFTFSNNYNPLENVKNSFGEIDETQVDILVDLYMKNAKAGKEAGGGDPFWDKSEKAFLTALIYYILEEDEDIIKNGKESLMFDGVKGDYLGGDEELDRKIDKEAPAPSDKNPARTIKPLEGGRCFSSILTLVQEAKVEEKQASPLTMRLNYFYARHPVNKTHLYYDTFLIAPQKTANTILITTAVDLQIFSTREVDYITRTNPISEANINIARMATQQSYLFLGIPQSHQAYNFLIAMLYSQLYGRLYELGERKLRGKWHMGYTMGVPVFEPFDSEKDAIDFFEHVDYEKKNEKDESDNAVDTSTTVEVINENKLGKRHTKQNNCIVPIEYLNGQEVYGLRYKDKLYKTTMKRKPLEKLIDDIDKMVIWKAEDYAGGDPSLPIHVNFLLDEFKNIGEIPNFLTILSTSRKYRIGSHVVIQDIGQLKTMYKDGEHETVMANVDTTIFLGSILKEDKEEIQKLLGKTTIRQKSTSSSGSGLSTSYTPTEVDLMSIDEISAINQNGRDDELVIVRDVTPFLCRKLNLTEHKRWSDVKSIEPIDLNDYYKNEPKSGKEDTTKSQGDDSE